MSDSEKLKEFCRITTLEIKSVGNISTSTSLEMIEYIRILETKLNNIKEIWSESWDCSRDPGHQMMNNIINEINV